MAFKLRTEGSPGTTLGSRGQAEGELSPTHRRTASLMRLPVPVSTGDPGGSREHRGPREVPEVCRSPSGGEECRLNQRAKEPSDTIPTRKTIIKDMGNDKW